MTIDPYAKEKIKKTQTYQHLDVDTEKLGAKLTSALSAMFVLSISVPKSTHRKHTHRQNCTDSFQPNRRFVQHQHTTKKNDRDVVGVVNSKNTLSKMCARNRSRNVRTQTQKKTMRTGTAYRCRLRV